MQSCDSSLVTTYLLNTDCSLPPRLPSLHAFHYLVAKMSQSPSRSSSQAPERSSHVVCELGFGYELQVNRTNPRKLGGLGPRLVRRKTASQPKHSSQSPKPISVPKHRHGPEVRHLDANRVSGEKVDAKQVNDEVSFAHNRSFSFLSIPSSAPRVRTMIFTSMNFLGALGHRPS